ncbi:MAG: hypothetical protein JNJ54_09000 [Myxococcaceae bacterium]|nr:hypothetical protein [Myxococcaceae bacterium]
MAGPPVAAEAPATGSWQPGAAKPRPRVQQPPARPAITEQRAPTSAEIAPEVRRDLSSFEARKRLATEASQVNPISADPKLNNFDRICGGAAAVNALILNSTTPEAAKQNAEALRSSLGAAQVKLPDALDKKALEAAIDHFAAGSPSMNDVFLLQQAAYAVGRRYDEANVDEGLNPAQLGGLVADLKARGATLDPNTIFSQSKAHWTVTVGDVTANSDANVTIDSASRSPANKGWGGDVVIRRDGIVEGRTPTVKDPDSKTDPKADLTPAAYCKKHGLEAPKADGVRRGWTFELAPASTTGDLLTKGDHLQQLRRETTKLVNGQKPPTTLR